MSGPNAAAAAVSGPTVAVSDPTKKGKTIHDMATGVKRTPINAINIQESAIDAVCDCMGNDVYTYTKHSNRRHKWMPELLKFVRKKSGRKWSYKSMKRLIYHCQEFGEVPARRSTRKKKHAVPNMTCRWKRFNADDRKILQGIVDEQPQLFLDEMQQELLKRTGKHWKTSAIWLQLHTHIKYSLKVAVFRANQQEQEEVDDHFVRIMDRTKHPRQLLFIDESAGGANASRRRRAWSPVGVAPTVKAPFVREFDERCSLIAACNWDGFILDACDIVERVEGETGTTDDENQRERGTVDTNRFEQCTRDRVVPVLGNFERGEPNSIVVMDNATIHNSVLIRRMTEDAGAALVYTAPYSPEHNSSLGFRMVMIPGQSSFVAWRHWLVWASHVWSIKCQNDFLGLIPPPVTRKHPSQQSTAA